jgi:hypothetical protein
MDPIDSPDRPPIPADRMGTPIFDQLVAEFEALAHPVVVTWRDKWWSAWTGQPAQQRAASRVERKESKR